MNWKASLDKYLTTEPDDGFDRWCEDIIGNKVSDTFYEKNEERLNKYDGQCNKWLNKLFNGGFSPEDAAKIIERAFAIYIASK